MGTTGQTNCWNADMCSSTLNVLLSPYLVVTSDLLQRRRDGRSFACSEVYMVGTSIGNLEPHTSGLSNASA